MQGLALKNFKSYSKQSILGLNPNINVIIGGNGQGKSNIFKAISFALSDRLQINRTQFNNSIHRGVEVSKDSDIEVEVLIKEKQGSDDTVKIAKLWKSDLNEECYVNSRFTSKKQYENFIESLRLSYTNPYNIVQQGKINQITLMDQFQLYRLLQQVTGAKKFAKRKQQCLAILKKIQIQKTQTQVSLKDLDQKLKSLQNKKQQFQFFAIEQKTKKYRTKKHISELLEGTKNNLQKIKHQYFEASQTLSKLIKKKQVIQQQLRQGRIFIRTGKQKLSLIQRSSTISIDPQTQTIQSQNFKEFEKKQKQLHKQLKQYAKSMKQKDKRVSQFKQQFMQIQQQFEKMKLTKQFQKPNQNRDKIISAFEAQIKTQQQRLKYIQEERKKLQEKIGQVEKHLESKKVLQNQAQFNRLQKQYLESRENIQLNKRQCNEMSIRKGVTNVECDSLKQILSQNQTRIRKVMPYLDFTLLDHLRQLKVSGVYGYFIQFVKIDENVSFAFEMAGMVKLCSLLVQDQQACTRVIEVNKKMKGKQVNIIQLSYVRSNPIDTQAIPKSSNVHKLNNSKWIKPDSKVLEDHPAKLGQDIQKLIKNTFGKYALVRDYDTGLKASKQYHINCITNDREVIFSEGYHCKLGQQNTHYQSKIQMFNKFQERRSTFIKSLIQKQQIENKLSHYQNEQIQLLNRYQKLQIEFNKLSSFGNQIKNQRKMLQIYMKNLQQLKKNEKDYQISIGRKQETIKNITSKNGVRNKQNKLSKAQCDKIQEEYYKKRKQLNKMMSEVFQIQQTMQRLRLEKEELDNKILVTKNSIAAGVTEPRMMGRQIQKQLAQKSEMLEKLEEELHRMGKTQIQIQADKDVLQVKLITYQAEQEDLQTKLLQIGQIQQNIEELEELSNSMSVSNMHGGRRRNHHFSTKDRLLFNKFGNILESLAAHKKTFAELQEAKKKIKRTIQKYEKDSEEYMSHMADRFQKQFIDIFTYIVEQGNVEVRFKKVSEKIKEVMRYKNCMMIRVSFSNSAQAMKKWTDFSGGEKTVIAISMILALQRCEPAPFYVLDQIDSALDSVFVQKIAELLVRESQRNKCQYFVSSFKQDMMAFPQEICHFYLVQCQNRVSSIEKISRRRAADAIKSLVMTK